MDPRLLEYYNAELRFLRESGAEFASAYPRIAARLGLETLEVADPYVERLIESFAFLAARVQLKLDARHPQFTQHLLEAVHPSFLNPVPACAIVEFMPDLADAALQAGVRIPARTNLHTPLAKGERTACQFTTGHEVTLWPLEVVEVKYLSGAGASTGVGITVGSQVRGAIRLRLRPAPGVDVSKLPIDKLRLHLKATADIAARLYEQLAANALGYYVRSTSGGAVMQRPATDIRPVGFDDDEALLRTPRRGFDGYRLLQEYFAFPQRFLFFDLTGLRGTLAHCGTEPLDIYIALDRTQPTLENALDPSQFRLHCAPVVNLFSRALDRVHVDAAAVEHHVIPDRNRPMDFEVYQIEKMSGVGTDGQVLDEVCPLYLSSHRSVTDSRRRPYYSVQRQPRLLSTRQTELGTRTHYVGTEVFVSIVDAHGRPSDAEISQLDVRALCTNRDLPVRGLFGKGRTDFLLEIAAPVQAIRCITGPTIPRKAPAFGDTAWNLVSHLSLNYLSLVDSEPSQGAAMLRELLSLYADPDESAAVRQIEGMLRVGYAPVVRRIPMAGPITFGRGLEITLTMDDAAFEGAGVLPLASVLERFFARYVSVNSFTQTRVVSAARGELKRWPARSGVRQLL